MFIITRNRSIYHTPRFSFNVMTWFSLPESDSVHSAAAGLSCTVTPERYHYIIIHTTLPPHCAMYNCNLFRSVCDLRSPRRYKVWVTCISWHPRIMLAKKAQFALGTLSSRHVLDTTNQRLEWPRIATHAALYREQQRNASCAVGALCCDHSHSDHGFVNLCWTATQTEGNKRHKRQMSWLRLWVNYDEWAQLVGREGATATNCLWRVFFVFGACAVEQFFQDKSTETKFGTFHAFSFSNWSLPGCAVPRHSQKEPPPVLCDQKCWLKHQTFRSILAGLVWFPFPNYHHQY